MIALTLFVLMGMIVPTASFWVMVVLFTTATGEVSVIDLFAAFLVAIIPVLNLIMLIRAVVEIRKLPPRVLN